MPIKKLKIYFIGIGGIGVSALAKYYLKKGHEIYGSDLVSSEITDALKKLGAKLVIGRHNPENLSKDIDLVIYSPAVKPYNPEFSQAKKYNLRIQSYPEALGNLVEKHFTIAVSGTHGKSTTTAMLGILLAKAGFDPTVIVGTKVKEFNDSNCRVGKSEYLAIEADEHFASFLNYWPKIIVLTTIETDHLDFYKNLNNILKTFKKYISHLPKGEGILVANKDDKNIHTILKQKSETESHLREEVKKKTSSSSPFKIVNYSLKQPEAKKLRKVLKIPGDHNVSNALAALATARALKIPDKVSFESLSQYRGSWRRFDEKELKIGNHNLKVIHDYGHHPTEVRVTLKAAREKYPKKKIWCVFQPHQYQRTYYLFNDFVKTFRKSPVERVIITDIYDVAGREEGEIKRKVNAEKLAKAIKNKKVGYLPKEKILDTIRKDISEIDILIVMGAGDIYDLFSHLY